MNMPCNRNGCEVIVLYAKSVESHNCLAISPFVKVEESKKENERLKSQVQLLSQQVGFEASEKLSFQSKTEMLESENECCKKKLNCVSEYCKNLESEKGMILKDYQTKATEVESLQAAIIQLESSNKKLQQELNERKQEMSTDKESMSSLRKVNDELHQTVCLILIKEL